MNHYDSDDLLGFMFSCMEKEHDRVLYHLKEDIGIEYLPVELLRDAIGDHPEQTGRKMGRIFGRFVTPAFKTCTTKINRPI